MRRRKKSVTRLKLKNSTRACLIIVALVLFTVSSKTIYSSIFQNKEIKTEKRIYDYVNKYNLDYDVNIKPNDFITETSLPKNQAYISDLVKSLSMKIDYEYNSSKDTAIKYDYKIDAVLGANYTYNGEDCEILNKVYNLKEVKNQESNKDIEISEDIEIDYQKYHKEIKQFKQSMGIAADAYLYIKLTVNTNTRINGQDVNNTYSSNFSITVGDKVAKVDGKDTDIDEQFVTSKVAIKDRTNNSIVIINVMILCASIYLIYYTLFKTYTKYNIKNDFKLELNRILKSCQDRIVVVNNKISAEEENIVDVKDFGELIKLSEELFKPILYWISEDEKEACFSVVSNKMNYRFILKK